MSQKIPIPQFEDALVQFADFAKVSIGLVLILIVYVKAGQEIERRAIMVSTV